MQETILLFLDTYKFVILYSWLAFFLVGTLVLYVGFGFVMCAMQANKAGKSQKKVYYFDAILSLFFLVLDILLNIFVYTFVCLDPNPKNILLTLSTRLSRYNVDEKQWVYRRWVASLFGAFLDGKDPSEDHITGKNIYLRWLD